MMTRPKEHDMHEIRELIRRNPDGDSLHCLVMRIRLLLLSWRWGRAMDRRLVCLRRLYKAEDKANLLYSKRRRVEIKLSEHNAESEASE